MRTYRIALLYIRLVKTVSSPFELFHFEHYAGRCIYTACALRLGLRVLS